VLFSLKNGGQSRAANLLQGLLTCIQSRCSSALASSSRTRVVLALRPYYRRPNFLPRISRSHASTDASAQPDINRIVDDISRLTLLQAADLVTLLKVLHQTTGYPCANFPPDSTQHSRNCNARRLCRPCRRRPGRRGGRRRGMLFPDHTLFLIFNVLSGQAKGEDRF
jgi:hypothetical protein